MIALLWSLGYAQPAIAQSLPNGGTVASGNVAISPTSPTSLTISQSSRTGIVNWSSFSIGQGNQVQFNNGSGATLNRVTGNVPSSINGVLSATGSVYLVNPSGVVVGPTGVVNTGGSFVASTLDVKDAEFRAGGSLTFSGSSNASVVNLGKIGASKGDVVLIARQVRNDGALTARNGTAAMASGSEVVLSDGSLGNGKVLVRRPAQDGEIRNSGAIRAAEVELRANGGNIYALAGNTGQAITATGVASKGGRIFLMAEGGSVNVTQKVVARRIQADVAPAPTRAGIAGRRAFTGGDVVVSGDKVVVGGAIEAKGNGGAGGTVVVTGTDVTLTSGAAIDASGTSGGTVLIGGDRAGGSDAALKFLPQTVANARTTTIEAGATITADGTSGAGGNVVVWSDGTTSFAGAISTQGAHGGFIETSGHVFNFTGGSVNAGHGGAWLLDPVDLTIDATLASTIATALNGGSNVTQLDERDRHRRQRRHHRGKRHQLVDQCDADTQRLSQHRDQRQHRQHRRRRCRAARRQCRHGHRHRDVRRRADIDRGNGLDLLQSDRQQLDRQRHQVHGTDADEFQRQRHRRRHAQDEHAGQQCL